MIKIIFCLRRLPSLSPEEFRSYWLNNHGPLIRQHADAMRVQRYTQSHTLSDPRLVGGVNARGIQIEPYDGVAELWWNSVDDLIEASSTKDGRAALKAWLVDEFNFLDLPRCAMFFAEEHVLVRRV